MLPESYNNRGYVEQMKKKYDKAINYYKKAIELRPYRRGVLLQHGVIVFRRA